MNLPSGEGSLRVGKRKEENTESPKRKHEKNWKKPPQGPGDDVSKKSILGYTAEWLAAHVFHRKGKGWFRTDKKRGENRS